MGVQFPCRLLDKTVHWSLKVLPCKRLTVVTGDSEGLATETGLKLVKMLCIVPLKEEVTHIEGWDSCSSQLTEKVVV